MGRGRASRASGALQQSEEARRLLKDDTPPQVKLALRLALRGGRQRRRRCKVCGGQGEHCQVHSDQACWKVEAPTSPPEIKVYWLCSPCYRQTQEQANSAQ